MTPTAKTAPVRRSRGRPARIDRAAILAAAGEMPAAELTMPAIAERLGVATSALYHYFANRDALYDAMADHLLADLDVDLPSDWRDCLATVARAFRDLMIDHPIVLGRETAAQRVFATGLMAQALRTLRQAGFSSDDAMRACNAVGGQAVWGAAQFREWIRVTPLADADIESMLDTTPFDGAMREDVRRHLRAFDAAVEFEATVEIILDGIAARLPPNRS